MPKKIICITLLIFFVTSCGDTLGSVKRGLTGEKVKSTDEFLIRKKDPLILPPDFENLPTPNERGADATEEISIIQKTLGDSVEETTSSSSSAEDSILRKIQSK